MYLGLHVLSMTSPCIGAGLTATAALLLGVHHKDWPLLGLIADLALDTFWTLSKLFPDIGDGCVAVSGWFAGQSTVCGCRHGCVAVPGWFAVHRVRV